MFESGDGVGGTVGVGGASSETVLVTCALDSRAHAVPDSELASAALDAGRLHALCGHVIAAAPLAEPDGEPCPQCEELRAPAIGRRRAGRRRRLL